MVMSDRIGVMRAGKLIQVGTPEQIYTKPRDKFVSEFMGEVNVIDIRLDGDGRLVSNAVAGRFVPPLLPKGFSAGHLVVRPEFVRFLIRADQADNHLTGRIYNEYALGSRIQYQVRVGEQVFILETLRQQVFAGRLDDEVLIGWNAADSIVVGD
jgi:spermidine/putrescine transport system ATP-binding protein